MGLAYQYHTFFILLLVLFQHRQVHSCLQEDLQSLLAFKRDITDPRDRLSSWVGENCCSWQGITCSSSGSNNNNSRVIRLDLRNPASDDQWSLGGKISWSLIGLDFLTYLDLSFNIFEDIPIPKFFGSFPSLSKKIIENIDLGGNQLKGTLFDWLGELKNLKSLQLYENPIYGSIPGSLGNLHSLEFIYISGTNLSGTIPNSFGGLSNLAYIDLSYNSLQGTISEFHFQNLTRLKYLDISSNNLSLEIRDDWIPPFQLDTIRLGSCKLGPKFPLWLKNQFNYSFLNMSHSEINDHLPIWFWNLSSNFKVLDLSHNKISGKVPTRLRANPLGQTIDLSSNLFKGPVPLFPLFKGYIDLSNNLFFGTIPTKIGNMMPKLQFLSLSNNNINGNIPSSICKMDALVALNLSRNGLTGKMLNCWKPNSYFKILDLSNNHFTGNVPRNISLLSSLVSLHLSNNSLDGGLPISLKTCRRLITIDLGNNKLAGEVPSWLGESFPNLRILSLQTNLFTGNIPHQLSNLSSLQILYLSNNNLSGTIPQTLGNLTAMKTTPKGNHFFYPIQSYKEYMILSIKNKKETYINLLPLVTTLDLSQNLLTGCIPSELTNLYGLLNLDLSGNQLEGTITYKFGQLQQLESLDLSRNYLNGPIPASLANLTFLSHLNLSYNNLSGQIPSGNQLSTFTDPSAYTRNRYLCGFPLPNKCETNQRPVPKEKREGKKEINEKEMLWTCLALEPDLYSPFGELGVCFCSKRL